MVRPRRTIPEHCMATQVRDAAIVGIYEYPSRKTGGGITPLQIKAECAARALADAGLGWQDVDGLYDAQDGGGMSGLGLAEYFGLKPNVIDTTYGSTAASDVRRIGTGGVGGVGPPSPVDNMQAPWGMTLIANYAMVAHRHMYQYGTTSAQLAEISVATRAHAMRNPEAVQAMTDLLYENIREVTVDDVLRSRMVADPLHLLDCCMVSDGGGAVVIASAGVARDCRKPPVWILGAGEATKYSENGGDITVSAGAQSGPVAFGEADVRPAEVDIAMIYDSFTITVMTCLEDLGFCKKGEGGAFVSGGRLHFKNPLKPTLNTDGGGLSSNHPGMRGIFLLLEATRQLRGESTSQVEGARLAVAHGNGGMLATSHTGGTIVLGRD
jgi:acetyl-CoA C-acetyltransferase